jgi:hypothetical protein
MAARITVACPEGHPVSTAVRGRGTTCATCQRTFYVRADGTTRHGQPGRKPGPARPPAASMKQARPRGRAAAPPGADLAPDGAAVSAEPRRGQPAPATPGPGPGRRRPRLRIERQADIYPV